MQQDGLKNRWGGSADVAVDLVVLQGLGRERDVTAVELVLRDKVAALEERLEQMRLSRRVLMRILERTEQDSRVELENLRRENERLRRQNLRLARTAWNERICHR